MKPFQVSTAQKCTDQRTAGMMDNTLYVFHRSVRSEVMPTCSLVWVFGFGGRELLTVGTWLKCDTSQAK